MESVLVVVMLMWAMIARDRLAIYHWYTECGHCGADLASGVGLYCGGCHGVKYCDVQCQRGHWRAHRDVCGELAEVWHDAQRFGGSFGPAASDAAECSPDAAGMLRLCDFGGGRRAYGFTRCTSTLDDAQWFVSGGMCPWPRDRVMEFIGVHSVELAAIWRLMYGRHGVVASSVVDICDVDSDAVHQVYGRGLGISLSRRRHAGVCIALGRLGLGLVSLHRRGRPLRASEWVLHDWSVLSRHHDVPLDWSRDIVCVHCTPLSSSALALCVQTQQTLAAAYLIPAQLMDLTPQ